MISVRQLIFRLWSAKSVHVAIWLGAGGLALMAGNLIFADVLDPEDFGRLALFQAFLAVGVGIGPLGLDQLSARGEVPDSWSTVGRAAVTATIVGGVAAAISWRVYGLSADAVLLLILGCAFGAVGRVCSAFDQARVHLNRSQIAFQTPFIFFCAGAVALNAAGAETGWLTGAAVMSGGYGLSGVVGIGSHLRRLFVRRTATGVSGMSLTLWARGLQFVGIAASVLLLLQTERLVIPQVLSLSVLADFTLVATLVGSPFRLLQGGIGYALTPQLRLARTIAERRRLIRHDLLLALAVSATGSLILVPLALPFIHHLYADKYQVSFALVVAVVAAGWIRILYGLASGAVAGVAGDRELKWFNVLGWAATGVAFVLAILLATPAGTIGVIAGATVGWALQIAAAWVLLKHAFRPVPRQGAAALAAEGGRPSG